MNDESNLLEADARRRAAMVAGDAAGLEELLADELVWTHSSGKTDGKASLIAGIASGTVVYRALETRDVAVLGTGDVLVCHGVLSGQAARDGREKSLNSRFLAVWRRRAGSFELLAWQSTSI
jgi:ketosteroid isomerase-like protein